MNPYNNELKALQRAGRYRERAIENPSLIDAASNDYLGLAHVTELHYKACETLNAFPSQAPKASMLVGGYHPIHRMFEERLYTANGFEAGIIMGSGFNANVGLIESLVRKGDTLLIDEEYHASGILGTRICEGEVIFFPHNDAEFLENELKRPRKGRVLIAVEGIYSMSGDAVSREIIELSIRYETLLILDEAHSSGVIGERLLGILDHYRIAPTLLMIKMGTLGKAYGSFGAYVLCSGHIESYLINRAKNVIYATAPSLYESARSFHAFDYIQTHAALLKHRIEERRQLVKNILGIDLPGLIVPVVIDDNRRVIELQKHLASEYGISVGAIRQPTVNKAIIRFIARTDLELETVETVCRCLTDVRVQ